MFSEDKLPLVSVIVPVYNAEKYLHRCIESIINQTYRNIEIILVNDGSQDNSRGICDEYSFVDKRVITIHQNNAGVSVARNVALNICRGSYICFVDADDYLDLNMISDNVFFIEKESADVVCFNYCKDYGTYKEDINDYQACFTDVDVMTSFFDDKTSRAVWNKFYRKSLWDKIRFPEDMPFAEDWFTLSYIYIYATKIVALEKTYYFYNAYNEYSICHQINEKQYFYDYLCNRQQLLLIENKLVKLLEYKMLWKDIVSEKAFKRCLKAYKINVFLSELSLVQKQEMRSFLLFNKQYINNLNANERISYFMLFYIPVLYRMITNLHSCRKKLSYQIRSCFRK